MNNIIFFDVDTQFDFMDPHGALYVPGAEEILPALRHLLDFAGREGITTISTLCSHREGDPELDRFPPHCMAGTPGQTRVLPDQPRLPTTRIALGSTSPRTLDQAAHYVAEKNTLDVFLNPWLAELARAGVFRDRQVFVFGIATDYCVRSAVLGLLGAGARVSLVTDAIKGLAPEDSEQALEEMRNQGAIFLTAKQTIKTLSS